MSSDYLTILQLTGNVTPRRLEEAYRLSRIRYTRLTARGPLRFFRNDLLRDLERAYLGLKHPAPKLTRRPISILARQLDSNRPLDAKPPVNSAVKNHRFAGADLSSHNPTSTPSLTPDEKRRRALIEDDFCREVIYRIEGDLIRFNSRQELLQLAREWSIPPFRANLLIAQIVQAVRQDKLYLDSPKSRKRKPRTALALTIAALSLIALDLLILLTLHSRN